MIDNPSIANYKRFYIEANSTLYDTKAQWGFLAKSNPYPALPNPKAPYNNEWSDLNGDDEYTTHIYYEAFTFDVEFYIRTKTSSTGTPAVTTTAVEELRSQMASFFNTVKEGTFKVYDEYTGLGRQNVRFNGYKENKFKARGDWAICQFTVTFKVNDPVTMMKMNDGGTAIVAIV